MNGDQEQKSANGFSRNVTWMGVVSFLNDLASDMAAPFIPIFLTSVLGASLAFVGLIEGAADAAASILKVVSGWISDKLDRRKSIVVAGYSLSAVAKPFLALATAPWHVLGVRFIDRMGKGVREAPRDALISLSVKPQFLGRAFGFHRAMDTLGAALGPLVAFVILPHIHNNYRLLFSLSFVASFVAVIVLAAAVREVKRSSIELEPHPPISPEHSNILQNVGMNKAAELGGLGALFWLFLAMAALASLGKASDAFLILKAVNVGIAISLIPILYFCYNITGAVLSTPFGYAADRIGKRRAYTIGLFLLAALYAVFAFTKQTSVVWVLFILYGCYHALTEGVGRAVVSDFAAPEKRGTALGIYNAATGVAFLPGGIIFGVLGDRLGFGPAFGFGAILVFIAAVGFLAAGGLAERKISPAEDI